MSEIATITSILLLIAACAYIATGWGASYLGVEGPPHPVISALSCAAVAAASAMVPVQVVSMMHGPSDAIWLWAKATVIGGGLLWARYSGHLQPLLRRC